MDNASTTPPASHSFKFEITNLSQPDARWLGELCRLYCDPNWRVFAEGFRRGQILLARGPGGELVPHHLHDFTRSNN